MNISMNEFGKIACESLPFYKTYKLYKRLRGTEDILIDTFIFNDTSFVIKDIPDDVVDGIILLDDSFKPFRFKIQKILSRNPAVPTWGIGYSFAYNYLNEYGNRKYASTPDIVINNGYATIIFPENYPDLPEYYDSGFFRAYGGGNGYMSIVRADDIIFDIEDKIDGGEYFVRAINDLNGSVIDSNIIKLEGVAVNFYNNTSENIIVDKSDYLKNRIYYFCTLKQKTSVMNPVLQIFTANQEILSKNYCYIPRFNRYYFINNVSSVRDNLWEFELSCDVLMSFKEILFEQECLIGRNEFEFDDMIVDDNVFSKKSIVPIIYQSKSYDINDRIGSFISKFKIGGENYSWVWQPHIDENLYISVCVTSFNLGSDDVLGDLGTPTISGTTTVYFMDNKNFGLFNQKICVPTFFDSAGALFRDLSQSLTAEFVSPFNVLKADKYFSTLLETNPFALLDESEDVLVADIALNTADVNRVKAAMVTRQSRLRFYSELDIPKIDIFYKKEPYTNYMINIPFVGIVPILSQRFEQGFKYLVYDVDLPTGDCVVSLSKNEPDYYEPIAFSPELWYGNIYIKIPIGSTSANEMHRNVALTAGNLISKYGNSIRDIKEGYSTRTPKRKKISKKGMRKIESAVKDIEEDTFSASLDLMAGMNCVVSSEGLPQSGLMLKSLNVPFVMAYKCDIFYPDGYNHYYGKPLMQRRVLKYIHGFTKISSVHLNNFFNATQDELNEIEDLLYNGIILP